MNFGVIGRFIRNHAPGILMGMGTAGTVTAVIFAVKATPAAERTIRDAELDVEKRIQSGELEEDTPYAALRPLPWQKQVALCWKNYIPAAGMTLFSLMCFWAAHGIDVKRQALIAGLYSTAEATLAEYQKKVIETIGVDENNRIKASIAQDRLKLMEPMPEKVPSGTDIWCVIDGRSFPSTYNKIKQAQNEFNHSLLQSMYKSKAELYWLLDPSGEYLRPTGDDFHVGWSIDKLLVLHVPDPTAPVLTINYEDVNGLDYWPKPGFSSSLL